MKFEKRPCPVCNSADDSRIFAESNYDENKLNRYSFASRKLPELMHHRLVLCGRCDLLYASPAPFGDELHAAYDSADFDSAVESTCASRTYVRHLRTILEKLPDLAGALDIGTGDGAFLERLLEKGFSQVIGVEPSSAPIESARPHVRELIRHGIFSEQDYLPSSFRLVTCFQTLEHLSSPASLCKAAYNLLKSPGIFFIVAHNRQSVSARILKTKSPIFDIEHLQLFSPSSMKYMLEQAGFKDITVRPIANSYPLQYWIKILPLPISAKNKMLSLLTATRLGGLRMPLWAGNMAAVGHKI